MQDYLESLHLIDPLAVYEYYPTVRDRNDIKVLKCTKSGIIFLSRSDHINMSVYEDKSISTIQKQGHKEHELKINDVIIKASSLDDTLRRIKDFRKYIQGKNWLDFGTGDGEIIEQLCKNARSVRAVEPNKMCRNNLQNKNFRVYKTLSEIKHETFDVITLFHVFEHLLDPIETLKKLKSRLSKNGIIIIEVPHANDFLLSTLGCEAFKKFTFWSEHLILHTKNSLKTFIQGSGFKNISIKGIQRYPLSNHLYWLLCGKSGGHEKWNYLNNAIVEKAYSALLQSLNQTDTLVAITSVRLKVE